MSRCCRILSPVASGSRTSKAGITAAKLRALWRWRTATGLGTSLSLIFGPLEDPNGTKFQLRDYAAVADGTAYARWVFAFSVAPTSAPHSGVPISGEASKFIEPGFSVTLPHRSARCRVPCGVRRRANSAWGARPARARRQRARWCLESDVQSGQRGTWSG